MLEVHPDRRTAVHKHSYRLERMKSPSRLQEATGKIWQKIDPYSLRVRLTLGIVAFTTLGLSSVAAWTGWKMQSILIGTHKQNIEYIADRLPQDLKIYNQMVPQETAMQKAVDNLTTGNTLLFVRRSNGTIAAQSAAFKTSDRGNSLLSLSQTFSPKLFHANKRYWVVCGTALEVNHQTVGQLYVAQDITSDQLMFLSLMRNLAIASLISIAAIAIAIAIYVQRSLQPLQRMSKLTETISAERLGEVQINLDNAPSEVKELAHTFDQMLIRLRDALEQQRQFVSNVSHELRTPLTIVSGYLQSTLRRGDNLNEPQREALEIATSEANRTIGLLKDLLDLARADSGRMHFNLEPLLLNDLVFEVVAMAEQYSNRAIAIEEPVGLIEVKAQRDRLKQVLLNLIDNAVKYSDPSTPITLTLDRQGERAIVQVCDRGNGIPLPQQARIFERFYRVDEARSRSTGGSGLGLSIVKTLVEGMGGSVSVRSKLGEGSVFTVTLLTEVE